MDKDRLRKELFSALEKPGFKARISSINRLPELEGEIKGKLREGLLDGELFDEYLSGFEFKPPPSLKDAKSIIVAAVSQPKIQVVFNWKGLSIPALIPPTYLHQPDERVEKILKEFLEPRGFHVVKTTLPLKILSACSGLTEYGKNNITYVEGIGSFFRLAGFYSDFPCGEDLWQEPKMVDFCMRCSACLRNCPTEAISSERFLLYAERCLTFHNERKAAFPSWLKKTWHHCLVGCLHCQSICPKNKDVWDWIEEREEFSEEETSLILSGAQKSLYPSFLLEKLENLSLIEYIEILPRNLRALLCSE